MNESFPALLQHLCREVLCRCSVWADRLPPAASSRMTEAGKARQKLDGFDQLRECLGRIAGVARHHRPVAVDEYVARDVFRGVEPVDASLGVDPYREVVAVADGEFGHRPDCLFARHGQKAELPAGETVDDFLLHDRHFASAFGTPRVPEGEQYDLTAQRREGRRAAVEHRDGEVRGLFAGMYECRGRDVVGLFAADAADGKQQKQAEGHPSPDMRNLCHVLQLFRGRISAPAAGSILQDTKFFRKSRASPDTYTIPPGRPFAAKWLVLYSVPISNE